MWVSFVSRFGIGFTRFYYYKRSPAACHKRGTTTSLSACKCGEHEVVRREVGGRRVVGGVRDIGLSGSPDPQEVVDVKQAVRTTQAQLTATLSEAASSESHLQQSRQELKTEEERLEKLRKKVHNENLLISGRKY